MPSAFRSVPDLSIIRHVALDMDGTIYLGSTVFECAIPFIEMLGRLRIGYTFLTNNPTKSVADYIAHLNGLGLTVTPDQLFTSTQATIEFLGREWPLVRRLFVLGTDSMACELANAGFDLVPDDPKCAPDAVVVGFDKTLTYSRLCRAAWWIVKGLPWFATNPDRVCPTDEPTVLVDCGSICAALMTATGSSPAAVMGKPDPAMLQGILRRHGLVPSQLAMVGDRLHTDIEMARRAGALSVLVLTGETTPARAAESRPAPDLVVSDVGELGRLLEESHART